jgi:hypothetical protein
MTFIVIVVVLVEAHLEAFGMPCFEAWVRRNEEPFSRSSFIDIDAIGAMHGSEPSFLVVTSDDVTWDVTLGWGATLDKTLVWGVILDKTLVWGVILDETLLSDVRLRVTLLCCDDTTFDFASLLLEIADWTNSWGRGVSGRIGVTVVTWVTVNGIPLLVRDRVGCPPCKTHFALLELKLIWEKLGGIGELAIADSSTKVITGLVPMPMLLWTFHNSDLK